MSTDRQPIHPIKTDPPDMVTGRKLSVIEGLIANIELRLRISALDDSEREEYEWLANLLRGLEL